MRAGTRRLRLLKFNTEQTKIKRKYQVMIDTTDTLAPTKAGVRGRMSQETMAQYREEEPELIRAWQEDGCAESLTRLLNRYRPMIGRQIQKILAGRSVGVAHRMDLEQEANIAFIHAVSSFNPDFGTYLSSFATSYIRKSLLRYALDFRHSYRIGTSSSERKAFYAALALRADNIHAGKSDVLNDEDIKNIQKATGSSEKATRRAVASIYASRTNIDDAPDLVDTDKEDVAEKDLAIHVAMQTLAPFIEGLGPRQKAILQSYLKDEDIDAYALADKFDLTPERIGQIKRDMLADMALFLKKKGIEAEALF
jgi:RNA polymerase sigma factor (sigma-70 family)